MQFQFILLPHFNLLHFVFPGRNWYQNEQNRIEIFIIPDRKSVRKDHDLTWMKIDSLISLSWANCKCIEWFEYRRK